jgi:hypothetical protein
MFIVLDLHAPARELEVIVEVLPPNALLTTTVPPPLGRSPLASQMPYVAERMLNPGLWAFEKVAVNVQVDWRELVVQVTAEGVTVSVTLEFSWSTITGLVVASG